MKLKREARGLRKAETPAEKLLWAYLRNRQFEGLKFRRQHSFGDYVLDFYCHEKRLVLELDGAVHEKPSSQKKDHKRDAWLAAMGLRVLRFNNDRVLGNPEQFLRELKRTIEAFPSPLGEG